MGKLQHSPTTFCQSVVSSCTRAGAGAGAVPHPVRAPPHRFLAGCGSKSEKVLYSVADLKWDFESAAE